MSQDQFWEQWTRAPEKRPDDAGRQEPRAAESGEPSGIDAEALAAWLKADELVAPAEGAVSPVAGLTPAELAELWPPAAPVDPFSGIQPPARETAPEWDLALDEPHTSLPQATPPVTGPAPAANPFPPAEPAPPHPSPFGPPVPPPPPPAEALQAPPLRLAITIRGRTLEQVVQGEALIGRPDATRRIFPEIDLRQDDAVSRRHAKIFIRDGRYVLTDLNSTNGTRYNDEWLPPEVEVPLRTGDRIEVGERTVIRVLEAPENHA